MGAETASSGATGTRTVEVVHRIRIGQQDAHYGGGLVDGARILALFGDAATELMIRTDGDEGLLAAYETVQFLSPTHAGDFLIPAQRLCSHLVVKERSQAEQLRTATFRTVAGAGHLLPVETPDVVNGALVEHFVLVEQDGLHG